MVIYIVVYMLETLLVIIVLFIYLINVKNEGNQYYKIRLLTSKYNYCLLDV